MSDKNKSTTDSADDSDRSPQVGALLRASRLRVGEDLREVSENLCIRFLYLEAIEECRYEDLPGDTYAIGFIRSYAEHLGLDGEEVVRRYRMEQASGKRLSDLSFPTPVPESGVPKGAIVLVGVVLAVVVYGGWYATTTDDSILSDLISPVPERLQHLVEDGSQPADGNNGTQQSPSASGTENLDPSAQGSAGVNTETQEALQANTAEAIAEATEAARDSIEETTANAADTVTEVASSIAETVTEEAEQAAAVAQEAAQAVADTVEAETAPAAEATSDASNSVTGSTDVSSSTATQAATDVTSAVPAVEPEASPAPQSNEVATSGEASAPIQESTAVTTTDQTDTSTSSSSADASSSSTASAVGDVAPITTENAEATQPAAEATPSAQAPEVSAEDLNAQSLQGATIAAAPSVSAAAPVETASAPASQAETAGAATTSSGIVIRATDNSWVQITDPANGEVLFTGLMGPGATFDVPARTGLLLDTGDAGAIDILVNGNTVPKLGGQGTVRKGVTLDSARLIAGTAVN